MLYGWPGEECGLVYYKAAPGYGTDKKLVLYISFLPKPPMTNTGLFKLLQTRNKDIGAKILPMAIELGESKRLPKFLAFRTALEGLNIRIRPNPQLHKDVAAHDAACTAEERGDALAHVHALAEENERRSLGKYKDEYEPAHAAASPNPAQANANADAGPSKGKGDAKDASPPAKKRRAAAADDTMALNKAPLESLSVRVNVTGKAILFQLGQGGRDFAEIFRTNFLPPACDDDLKSFADIVRGRRDEVAAALYPGLADLKGIGKVDGYLRFEAALAGLEIEVAPSLSLEGAVAQAKGIPYVLGDGARTLATVKFTCFGLAHPNVCEDSWMDLQHPTRGPETYYIRAIEAGWWSR